MKKKADKRSKQGKRRLKDAKKFANKLPKGKFIWLDYDPSGYSQEIRYFSCKKFKVRFNGKVPDELWVLVEGIQESCGEQIYLGIDLCVDGTLAPTSDELIVETTDEDRGEFLSSIITPIGTFEVLSFAVERNCRLVWHEVKLTDMMKEILSLKPCACGVNPDAGVIYAGLVSKNPRINFPLYPPEYYTPGTSIYKLAKKYHRMIQEGKLINSQPGLYGHLRACYELGGEPMAKLVDADTGKTIQLTGEEAVAFIEGYIKESGEDFITRDYVIRPD